MSIANCRA